MAQYKLSFEDLANGTAPTTPYNNFGVNLSGDGTATAVGDDAHVAVGVRALKMTPTANSVPYLSRSIAAPNAAVRMAVYVTSYISGQEFNMISFPSVGSLGVNSNGTLRIRGGSGIIWTSAAGQTLPLNQWAYVNLYVIAGTTTTNGTTRATIDLGNPSSPTVDSGLLTGVNTGVAGNISAGQFGLNSTSTGYTTPFWIDDLTVDNNASNIISSGNAAPTVNVTPVTQNVTASATVNLTASASDPDGTIASHAWAFDFPASGAPSLTGSTTANPSFTAGSSVGNLYVVKDTVTDNGGATGYDTAEVRIPSSSNVTALPGYTPVGTAWTVAGGAANESAALSDSSSSTYVESPDITSTALERRWRIRPMTTRTSYRFTLFGISITTATSHSSAVRIYQGNTLITQRATNTLKRVSDNATTDLTTTPTDLYLDLTAGEISAVTDPGDLWLAIQTEA